MRRRLLDLCNYELGDKQECYVHVTFRGDLYAAIYHACEGLARTQLLSISVHVRFATGDNFLNKRIT